MRELFLTSPGPQHEQKKYFYRITFGEVENIKLRKHYQQFK